MFFATEILPRLLFPVLILAKLALFFGACIWLIFFGGWASLGY